MKQEVCSSERAVIFVFCSEEVTPRLAHMHIARAAPADVRALHTIEEILRGA